MNRIFSLLMILALSACTKATKKPEIWIYTSTFKEVVATYDVALKKAFPDLNINWFQGGSENVAARVLAELSGGGVKADLMITSDLFFYGEMKKRNALLPLTFPEVNQLPANCMDVDRAFAITRFPVMGIAYNNTMIAEKDRPTSFADLKLPRFKDKLVMPSPLESGTTLTSVLFLKSLFGMDYFKALRGNNILSAGGNSVVLSRIQSGERPVGIVLMESILQAKQKGQRSVDFVLPSEGGIPIPSPMAIFKNSAHPKDAERVFAWFMGAEAQEVLAKGWVYSALNNAPTPTGGTPFASLKLLPWDLKTLEKWGEERNAVKAEFQNIVLK